MVMRFKDTYESLNHSTFRGGDHAVTRILVESLHCSGNQKSQPNTPQWLHFLTIYHQNSSLCTHR